MQNKIAAGIVLYSPDIDRLKKNLEAIVPQVEKVFLVDNHSDNIKEVKKMLEQFPVCKLIKNEKNAGIATALNQLMSEAQNQGYAWLLTLDDDSVCEKDMVGKLTAYKDKPYAGIVCPRATDDKMSALVKSGNPQVTEVDSCITAGSLTNIEAWNAIGNFDDKMFIDFVDVEYCTRLREHGYRIYQVNSALIHQQYGNISGEFSILGRTFYLFNYSPVRVYYSVRNQIYYMKKHKSFLNMGQQRLFLIGYIGKRIVFEKNRVASFKAVIRGIKDGIRM